MEGGVAILRRVQEVSLGCYFPGHLCGVPLINSSSLSGKKNDIVFKIRISAHVSIG